MFGVLCLCGMFVILANLVVGCGQLEVVRVEKFHFVTPLLCSALLGIPFT